VFAGNGQKTKPEESFRVLRRVLFSWWSSLQVFT